MAHSVLHRIKKALGLSPKKAAPKKRVVAAKKSVKKVVKKVAKRKAAPKRKTTKKSSRKSR